MLNEKYKNLFTSKDKQEYADDVFELIQKAYAPIGGIKGNGFRSPEDMIKNIPMWKLYFKNGVLSVVRMYKDKGGRKAVATATNGTPEAKTELARILKANFKVSYSEMSDPLLKFLVKNYGVDFVKSYAIKPETKQERTPEIEKYCKNYPELCDYFYTESFGEGVKIVKIKLGTPGKTITFREFLESVNPKN